MSSLDPKHTPPGIKDYFGNWGCLGPARPGPRFVVKAPDDGANSGRALGEGRGGGGGVSSSGSWLYFRLVFWLSTIHAVGAG